MREGNGHRTYRLLAARAGSGNHGLDRRRRNPALPGGRRRAGSAGGAMTFADFVAGDTLFLDANTLVYHFGPDPVFGPPCTQLVQRIENQELQAFTSTHILGEVAHRLM